MESPLSYFSNLKDSRVERTREHDLEDILGSMQLIRIDLSVGLIFQIIHL
jgi:hypothetical protein